MGNPRRATVEERLAAIEERLQKGGGRRGWSDRQEAAQQGAFEDLAAPFDFLEWLKNNWQAGIIIAVCLLILTR